MRLDSLLALGGFIALASSLPSPFSSTNTTTATTTGGLFTPSSSPSHSLTKRSSYGWIGSFYLSGCATHGPLPSWASASDPEHGYVDGGRPKLRVGKCVAYSPQYMSNYIGLDWGAGRYGFHRLEIYRSSDCSGDVDHVVQRKGGESGACWSSDVYAQWDLWMSVKAVK